MPHRLNCGLMLYHFRLTAQMNILRNGYNNLSITLGLGLVLGGRPKKK